jgi:hypothetical protein
MLNNQDKYIFFNILSFICVEEIVNVVYLDKYLYSITFSYYIGKKIYKWKGGKLATNINKDKVHLIKNIKNIEGKNLKLLNKYNFPLLQGLIFSSFFNLSLRRIPCLKYIKYICLYNYSLSIRRLGNCKNLKKVELFNFLGDYNQLNTLTNIKTLSIINKSISSCENFRFIQYDKYIYSYNIINLCIETKLQTDINILKNIYFPPNLIILILKIKAPAQEDFEVCNITFPKFLKKLFLNLEIDTGLSRKIMYSNLNLPQNLETFILYEKSRYIHETLLFPKFCRAIYICGFIKRYNLTKLHISDNVENFYLNSLKISDIIFGRFKLPQSLKKLYYSNSNIQPENLFENIITKLAYNFTKLTGFFRRIPKNCKLILVETFINV